MFEETDRPTVGRTQLRPGRAGPWRDERGERTQWNVMKGGGVVTATCWHSTTSLQLPNGLPAPPSELLLILSLTRCWSIYSLTFIGNKNKIWHHNPRKEATHKKQTFMFETFKEGSTAYMLMTRSERKKKWKVCKCYSQTTRCFINQPRKLTNVHDLLNGMMWFIFILQCIWL